MRILCLLLLLAASACADTVFSFMPLPASISAAPGQTTGWGYRLTNLSTDSWLEIYDVQPTSAFEHATLNLLFDYPVLAPLASVDVYYQPGLAGLAELTWDVDAPSGFVNSGDFVASARWYTDDPASCGFTCTDPFPFQDTAIASYEAVATPEPALLLPVAALLLLGWRRRHVR